MNLRTGSNPDRHIWRKGTDVLPSVLDIPLQLKKDIIYNKGVSTKGEPIAPRADLSAWCYSLPPVDAGGLATLGWRN
jgi:hypothetical protein